MPIYEYQCKDCGRKTTELRSMSEREQPVACPHCGGEAEVVLSSFAQGRGASDGCPPSVKSNCPSGSS